MSDHASGRTALHPDEALALVEAWDYAPEVETVPIARALGRALAGDLPALVDQPPFDKSAMDGFAYGRASAGADAGAGPSPDGRWRVATLVAAGHGLPAAALGPGECARIMTGAPLPPGATRVQRIEWTADERGPEGPLVRFTKPESETNVIRRGENQKAGDPLVSRRVLLAQDIGILASSGYAEVPVARRPIVGVLSTGDELAAPGVSLPGGAIYDSNGPQLVAQAALAGCDARYLGIVHDEPGALERAVRAAAADCDVLVVSGGVSMGDFDYVPRTLAGAGFAPRFHGLAMRPGKPTFFGASGRKVAFGLPGNPVSTFVNFEVLVKAHLYRRVGLRYAPRLVAAVLAEPLARKGTDRVEFLPACLETPQPGEPGLVRPLEYRGSSMLSVLSRADCLLRMELGESRVEKGRTVLARLLRA